MIKKKNSIKRIIISYLIVTVFLSFIAWSVPSISDACKAVFHFMTGAITMLLIEYKRSR